MSLVRLNIKGISYSQTHTGAYALVLSEVNGTRTLPIVIGAFEAQSIAISLEKEIKPPRPLTHDLFKNFADRFHIVITQVIIHKLVDGIFYSSIICKRDGIEEIIDTRTSDAIALATRFKAPIFTYENILDKAGVQLKDKEEKDRQLEAEEFELPQVIEEQKPVEKKSSFHQYTLDDLQLKLNEAVANEDYELAAQLRDEIEQRS
ncbi:MAG: bifunctional nuclease family protein [Flavobacteriaceae bacterium]|nr:bifunctional nuclease family protein [Flavobacteriaceae bacterium]